MEGCWFLAPNTALLATGVSIISISTKYWTQTSYGFAGLWKGCVAFGDTWECGDTKWPHSDDGWMPAVKALVLLSIILALFSMTFSLMAYVVESFKWTRLAIGMLNLQVLCLVAGLVTFLAYISKYGHPQDLSWSYYFGWVSVGMYIFAIIFFSIQSNRLRARNVYQNIN